jgi:hypothetical protein
MRKWTLAGAALSVVAFSCVVGVSTATASRGAARARAAASPVRSDFDGDGIADLAIGAPGDDVGSVHQAGTVTVLYGTANGPDTARVELWSAATPGVKGVAIQSGRFGSSLAPGDFDGDGFSDLAVGATGEGAGTVAGAGAVHVLYGSADGLTADGNQRWTQGSPGVPGDPENDDRFGRSLVAGDFGHGPQDDLAIAVSDENVGDVSQAGGVNVLYGTANGLRSNGAQLWDQSTPGVPGVPEEEESFGASIAAANLGKGPQSDLAIGISQDHIGGLSDVGSILVLYGSAGGLSTTGRQSINEDDLGTPVAEHDVFGTALAAGNFGGSSAIDLAVGAPGAAVDGVDGAGAVFVAFGGSNGLSLNGAQRWTQAATGTGATEEGDFFGFGLAAGKFGKSAQADLAVGVPFEDIDTTGGARADAGSVTVLYGAQDGLAASGAQGFIQSNLGVGAAVEASDELGFELDALSLGHGTQSDLVMGDAFEDIGSVFDSGAVFVLFGSSTGLTTANAQSWNQDTAGVPGEPLVAGRFGEAVG